MAGEERPISVLLQALQSLRLKEFQEFKKRLSKVRLQGRWSIPKDLLEEATYPSMLLSYVGRNCSEETAVDIAIGVFQEMNQKELAERLLDENIKEYKRNYRDYVARNFLLYKEVNACLGDSLTVSSRYTDLTIAWKPPSKGGGEHEAVGTSHGCGGTRNGAATTTITAQMLFKPDEDGQTPQVVVLVGAPGMGKTMTVRKVMVEWREGSNYTQFDYIFCINCKDKAFTKEVSVADLISQCCPYTQTPAGRILDNPEKILLIFDGFEALGFSLLLPEDELISDPMEVKPLETIVMSLLKKTVLPECSLLITTRSTALQSLGRCLEGECYAEILGFSAAKREEYFHRFFKDDYKADVIFRFTKDNEILHSFCIIPMVCWLICTILDQEFRRKKNLLKCSKVTAWMGVYYLSRLMRCRGEDKPPDFQQFLHKLCSLAADGIWKHKVLFEEKEIKDYGLDQPDFLPLFLNEKISKKSVDHGNVYSFTHLHIQELLAALFYVLEDDEEAAGDSGALKKDVNMLLESYSESRKDLSLTVRYLFGLVNQKTMEYVDKTVGFRISPRAREDMLRWLQGRHRGTSKPSQELKISELDIFHFLFEMNEPSFAQSALGCFTDIDLQDIKLTLYDQMALSFCIQHWPRLGCVSLRGCSFEQQDLGEEMALATTLERSRRREEPRSPIHLLCQALRHAGSFPPKAALWWCGLSESCCMDLAVLLAEHPGLAQLELGDGVLGDSGVRLLCRGLRHPHCHLRVLR
ncbi:NLRP3 protein, partial [Aegotheles bennettii]|nr:NLRP3 protein [Aegotheles bennettii]